MQAGGKTGTFSVFLRKSIKTGCMKIFHITVWQKSSIQWLPKYRTQFVFGFWMVGHLVFNRYGKPGIFVKFSNGQLAKTILYIRKYSIFIFLCIKWFQLMNNSKTRQICPVFELSSIWMPGSSWKRPFKFRTSLVFRCSLLWPFKYVPENLILSGFILDCFYIKKNYVMDLWSSVIAIWKQGWFLDYKRH
jgi:hypothetical protein